VGSGPLHLERVADRYRRGTVRPACSVPLVCAMGKSVRGKKVDCDVYGSIRIDNMASRPQVRSGTQEASQARQQHDGPRQHATESVALSIVEPFSPVKRS